MFNTVQPMTQYSSVNTPSFQRQAHYALVFHTVSHKTVTTKHRINEHNQLCAGTVVDPIDVIQAALQADHIKNGETDVLRSKVVSVRVIVDDNKTLIWHSKAQHRPMWFAGHEIGTLTLRVWWPNLVFILDKRTTRLSVFATATGARPKDTTVLYRAPVMNVDADGSICLGSAKLPKDTTSANIEEMENCLYDSNFSHLNFEDTAKRYTENDQAHVAFYRERQKNGKKFTAIDLLRIGRLGDYL